MKFRPFSDSQRLDRSRRVHVGYNLFRRCGLSVRSDESSTDSLRSYVYTKIIRPTITNVPTTLSV